MRETTRHQDSNKRQLSRQLSWYKLLILREKRQQQDSKTVNIVEKIVEGICVATPVTTVLHKGLEKIGVLLSYCLIINHINGLHQDRNKP
jgi:hypothetical protein